MLLPVYVLLVLGVYGLHVVVAVPRSKALPHYLTR